MCNRSLKQTAISLSSREAEFYAASACARELRGLAELFKELHFNVPVRLEIGSVSVRRSLQRRRPGGLKHIEIRCFVAVVWELSVAWRTNLQSCPTCHHSSACSPRTKRPHCPTCERKSLFVQLCRRWRLCCAMSAQSALVFLPLEREKVFCGRWHTTLPCLTLFF